MDATRPRRQGMPMTKRRKHGPPVHKVAMGNSWRVAACGADMMGKRNWHTKWATVTCLNCLRDSPRQ